MGAAVAKKFSAAYAENNASPSCSYHEIGQMDVHGKSRTSSKATDDADESEPEIKAAHGTSTSEGANDKASESHRSIEENEGDVGDYASECDGSDEETESDAETESTDDLNKYFKKLSEETLLHQSTTRAELLVLGYVVNAERTRAQVRGLLILISSLYKRDIVPRTTYSSRKFWKKKDAIQLQPFCQACKDYLGASHELMKSLATRTAQKNIPELGTFRALFCCLTKSNKLQTY